ncbi:acyl-CoA dehydrogenase [Streptomyces sp. I05A-00742]|uniref:acyl-CoA dehydrogenase family protein n=1 Tax=Streptomyces sp. I05A-00742 TaxID=2732853 RepID=UPI001487E493|nr:acyl-CoA dehydrogenase [Streptomyces sp. I05A-00742]
MTINAASPSPNPTPVPDRARLTELLFLDGPSDTDLHAHWRKAVSADLFRHPGDAPAEERWRLAYRRLRALNDELPVPAENLASDPRALASLHEWASVVDGATATVAGIHYNLFLGSLLDDEASPPRDLGAFTSLARTGTFLCTEDAHGNDAAALETVARYDREHDAFVLHTPNPGARKYMPNTSPAGGAKTAVVAARLLVGDRDEGAFLFLTPLTDHHGRPLPGITVEPLPERVGSPVDHCVTAFDHVRLPRTALLQGAHGRLSPDGTFTSAVGSTRKRFLHAIGRVTTGKLCMSASTLGGSRAALAIATRYGHLRHVSGPGGRPVPLVAHRSHHARLLERVATAYAMTFLHRYATARWADAAPAAASPADRAEDERLVAVVKGWVTWQARDITVECRERCGARALFPVNGLAEYPANAEGAITAEGDNLAVWCKAGAEMIFGREPAPRAVEATGAEDPADPDFLRRALAAAERHWHLAARRDLRGTGTRREDAFARWNNASDAALNLVETHAVGLAADAFTAVRARVTDPGTRSVLDDLCALFLLRQVGPRAGLLLAERALTDGQVRALPEATARLTARLAPHLSVLTEAFDVPEEHLASLPMLTGRTAVGG